MLDAGQANCQNIKYPEPRTQRLDTIGTTKVTTILFIIALPASRNNTLFLTAFLAGVTLFVAGCFDGAPRRHPLDPQGENFMDAGGLSVQVTSFYPPQSGLSDATVRVSPGSFISQTDQDGRVFIPDLSTGTYTVTVEKDNFEARTQSINIVNGATGELTIALPALPIFVNIDATTQHISRWWPPPEEQYQLSINIIMEDNDGISDIESVAVEIPELGFTKNLTAQNEPGHYALVILENELSVSVASLLGRAIILSAQDRAGTTNVTSGLNLVRVIDQSPLAVAPQSLEVLSTTSPQLSWEAVSLNFPFSYRVEIVRVDDNVQNLIWSMRDISSDSLSVTTAPLPTGQYFWTVSVADEFGNLSRSREAGFRIP